MTSISLPAGVPNMPSAEEICGKSLPKKCSVSYLMETFGEENRDRENTLSMLVFGRFQTTNKDLAMPNNKMLDVVVQKKDTPVQDSQLHFFQVYCTSSLVDQFWGTMFTEWAAITEKATKQKKSRGSERKFFAVTVMDLIRKGAGRLATVMLTLHYGPCCKLIRYVVFDGCMYVYNQCLLHVLHETAFIMSSILEKPVAKKLLIVP